MISRTVEVLNRQENSRSLPVVYREESPIDFLANGNRNNGIVKLMTGR